MAEHKIIDLTRLGEYDLLIKEYIKQQGLDSIRVDTTASWSTQTSYVPPKGQLIIYLDGNTVDDVTYPKFKVGDGNAYVVDLPFTEGDFEKQLQIHIANQSIHLSATDRTKLENSIVVSLEAENLILSN
jgi:hypothetical protein